MKSHDNAGSRVAMDTRTRAMGVAAVAAAMLVLPANALAGMRPGDAPRTVDASRTTVGTHPLATGDTARAHHLLSRATWGVRPADLAAVLETGAEAWLERQLHPHRIDDSTLETRLDAFPTTRLGMGELYRDFSPQPELLEELRRLQVLRDSLGDEAVRQMIPPEQRRQAMARSLARLLNELVAAKITRAVYSERQLEDVMTDFWFNHFNVFFNKGQVRYLAGDYERTAIRPHVFGRFEDMLRATAQHPAMLFYLDNWQSVHVDTSRGAVPGANIAQLTRRLANMTQEQKDELVRSGRITAEQLASLERGEAPAQQVAQRMRNRGLNENYARELLELHTLGVDGGYTQQDVIEVARAFTGWTFRPYNAQQAQRAAQPGRGIQGRPGQPGMRPGAGRGVRPAEQPVIGPGDVPFMFRPDMHDRGEKVVLGKRLPAGRGMEDGLDVLAMLARHPSTARHIATKLVERFVADEPPQDLVDHIAGVFLATDGDLRAVTRALFTADAFHRDEYRGTKVKTPYELVVSALRATHAEVRPSQRINQMLRTMGHLPYGEPAPTGYPAMSEDWVNTGAMLNRMNFALDLASGRVDGVRLNGAVLMGAGAPGAGAGAARTRPGAGAAVAGELPLARMLATVLPGTDTSRLAERIREDMASQQEAAPRQRVTRALGLALGSPEFQRR